MKKLIPAVLAVVLLCSLPLAACTAPSAPSLTGQGSVLKLYGIDPITLDPAVSAEMTSHEFISQIFSGLVRFDENLEPSPDIAEKWEISPDGRKYTFTLRQDVRFQDGRTVTAADFKYSWERACAPSTKSRIAATYLGDIVGVADVLSGKTTEISGVRVTGDYTLEVTIDAPKSYFLAKLTYPTAYVVDRANVQLGGEWWRQPNGTGPFKLEKWDEGNLLVLAKNDLYYGDKAKVDRVEFQMWSGVPMRMYEMGDIDVTGISVYDIDRVTDEAGPFAGQLRVVPELSFSYIGFNQTAPPFDDVNLRLAFIMAVDREKIVSLILRDLVQKADGILPPGLPGYNPDLIGHDYDPAKAKELIAASKYGSVSNLPPIVFTTQGYGAEIPSYLDAVIQDWRDNLGVEVTVRELEPERFIYNLTEEKDQMFDMGWIADYPHPQDFLDVLFRSGAENNFGEYSYPAVDDLLKRAGVEKDFERSLEMYRQAEQMLVDDAACLPLWFGKNYILVKPYVQGYELNPMGFAMLNTVSIQPH